jgi:sugar phosphate isomerase/epimerase
MAGSAPVWLASNSSAAPAPGNPPRMGGAPTAFASRMRAGRGGGQPFDIIEHCHNIGLGGVQTNPPSLDPEAIKKFRARVEAYNFHLICDPRLPRQKSDVDAFDTQVKAFKEAGAAALHVALTGRRYEDFDSFEPWKNMFEGIKAQTELAEPVLRKYKMRLGMENHKGYRAAEQAAFLKRLGSEYVGVCLDFGNNLSLCEDPMDTLNTLLPYIFYTHIKDMAVQEYEDGFLLSEVIMGEGMLDLKEMVRILRQKDPNMIFELEMITRDPLKIPVYTKKYWATFDDSYSPLPGRDLAKTLALVKKNKPKAPLPKTAGLSTEAQIKLEDDLNAKCIAWAKQNLSM